MKNWRLNRAFVDSEYAYRTRGRPDEADRVVSKGMSVCTGVGAESGAAIDAGL
jgi:hypothetical protein